MILGELDGSDEYLRYFSLSQLTYNGEVTTVTRESRVTAMS